MRNKIEVPSNIIIQLQNNDERAFRVIYNMLHERIYRMLLSLIKDTTQTEELVQQTFISLWVNRKKLNPSQSLYPYVYLTARRLAIDHFRKSITETNAKEYLKRQSTYLINCTEDMVRVSNLIEFTSDIIKSLPPQQRKVYTLSRNEGLSYDEISERMKISRNTVKNHLVSALKTLRIEFIKNDIMYFYLIIFAI